jgi:hypothetical protein
MANTVDRERPLARFECPPIRLDALSPPAVDPDTKRVPQRDGRPPRPHHRAAASPLPGELNANRLLIVLFRHSISERDRSTGRVALERDGGVPE